MSEPESRPALPSAPLWRRFAALSYDLFLLIALSMAYGGLVTVAYVVITGDRGEAYMPMFDGPWFQLGWLAVICGFYTYFWRRGGQTLGMRAWRIQLQNQGEGEVTLKQCALRSLAGIFSLSLAGIGYWWAWFDPDRLCLHDRVSRTRVVVLPKGL